MKPKRWILILVVLVGLVYLATLPFLGSKEPTYQGKTVSVWFKEYAYGSNTATRPIATNLTPPMHAVLAHAKSNGVPPQVLFALSNQYARWASADLYEIPPRDPALEALQALGSNAVPYLLQYLRVGPLDRTYDRVVTNLPVFVQSRLPSPTQKRWDRNQALEALSRLEDSARSATPVLLELLRKPEPFSRLHVLATLRSIYADAYSISDLLLELGKEQHYADVLETARQTKWQGREVAQLFGEILHATNTALHRDAIYLLESSGERAAPALDGILAALRSTDGEVRYLAARTMENIGRKVMPEAQSRVAAALAASLDDEKDTVRNVARRAMAKLSNSADAPAVDPLQRPPGEVNYDGKTVEEWFQAYVASRETRVPANASPVMNGELLPRTPVDNQPDPAWTAFQVLGEKAIPGLLRHLNSSGEPATSEQAQLAQSQAIDLIHRLGPVARSAAPALLTLLKQVAESQEEALCAAIASVRPESQLINQFLLDLGKEQRDADMLHCARRLGWNGPDVARRLGAVLQSPNREDAHAAITLLEAAGSEAHAATEAIILALSHRDQEIRYLATRALAKLASNSPPARKALQDVANDPNGMVRTVARKAIAAQAETLSPGSQD
jgi:hypothetical protein